LSPARPAPEPDSAQEALQAAFGRLLVPLARLAVARGVPFAALEELLKRALVQAADAAHAEVPPHRRVSRISTATGIHRREATRLLQQLRDGPARGGGAKRSRAHELLAHWLASPPFRDRRGRPRVLPRHGPGASFEALAQAVTRDVHPRSMLDEMIRLGMVEHDPGSDKVRLARDAATPRGDEARMLQFLADNVGDHLDGAVDNVLADGRRHFEQAVYADGLSPGSMDEVKRRVTAQWQALLAELVPALEALVAGDDGRPDASRRLRVGLYTYEDEVRNSADEGGPPAPKDNRR
jgi:hypothetical protein